MVYSDAQGGMINITDTRTGTQKTIYPYPNRVGSVGDKMLNHKYRWSGLSPIVLSPENPRVVYFGGNVLFKSHNHGMSWDVISPDLTTNDPAEARRFRRPDRRGQHRGRVPLHDHLDRAVAPGLERDLGRDRRRQRPGHARWRKDLEQRVQERPRPEAQRVDSDGRCLALQTWPLRGSPPITIRTMTIRRTRT